MYLHQPLGERVRGVIFAARFTAVLTSRERPAFRRLLGWLRMVWRHEDGRPIPNGVRLPGLHRGFWKYGSLPKENFTLLYGTEPTLLAEGVPYDGVLFLPRQWITSTS